MMLPSWRWTAVGAVSSSSARRGRGDVGVTEGRGRQRDPGQAPPPAGVVERPEQGG